ncbi:MAG: hypothetical protein AAGF30_00305 [Pseudomonadota bacterium]
MTDKEMSPRRRRAEEFLFWWRIAMAGIVGLGAIAAFLWELLGPGIIEVFRDPVRSYVGFDELTHQQNLVLNRISGLGDRVQQIERWLPPPAVLAWDRSSLHQDGDCTRARCIVRITAGRTEYGALCGAPKEIEFFIQGPGYRPAPLFITNEFRPITLSTMPRELFLPFRRPSFLPDGDYEWRATVTYENCPGVNEPIPRMSPWFPITLSSAADAR